ncbi:HAD-IA family hydrolase [Methylocella sp.]|uniref:HAD-IA family hydrolase n=1 Tax=Methylocella sp. TaxID=1978226 RepID=UPI0037831F61
MHTPVKAFIFDLGGVLVRHDNALLYDRLAACCPDPAGGRAALIRALEDEAIGTGALGVPELHARLVAEHGFSQGFAPFLDLWSCHFSAEPDMEDLLGALKTRYRVSIFSNTNAAHIEHIRARYPAFGAVDAVYLSYELGLVKPHAAAFRKVLELEGLAPQDCVFVDDRADNTAAAAALGMKAVTFTDRAALEAAVAEFGVAVDA